MKKLVIYGILLMFFLGCEKADNPKTWRNNTLSQYIIQNYSGDAKQLYMHELINNPSHPGYNNPIIDTNETLQILNIIQAVYELNIPERDTVFKYYNIHRFSCYALNSIRIKVNPEDSAIMNLGSGNFNTGNADLDTLLKRFKFDSIRTAYNYPSTPWITLYTDKKYNMLPVTDEFANLSPILLADFNKTCIGDGNDITLNRTTHKASITFSIGKGDCPAGCLFHRYWQFEVKNGIARFKKSWQT